MNKKQFVNTFPDEDQNIISSLYEKINLCKEIDGIIYTDIYFSPHVWTKLIEMESSLGVLVELKGITKECEKKLVAFRAYGAVDILKFPAKIIKISNSSKFNKLEHRHFLAGILSIGIKREKIGDLIVKNGVCYTIIYENLFEFLQNNLLTIGKSKVKIVEVGDDEIPENEFKIENYLLTSLRLDSIVASLNNCSRSEGLKLINSSQVMVNYKVVTDKSINIKEGAIISIRRNGKYIFIGTNGETKKGKFKTTFKKYI